MFPGLTWLLYIFIAYATWYVITRLAFGTAWVYARKGTWDIRHYLMFFVGLAPFALELCSTILIIFAAAFGFDPHKKDN